MVFFYKLCRLYGSYRVDREGMKVKIQGFDSQSLSLRKTMEKMQNDYDDPNKSIE